MDELRGGRRGGSTELSGARLLTVFLTIQHSSWGRRGTGEGAFCISSAVLACGVLKSQELRVASRARYFGCKFLDVFMLVVVLFCL